MNKLLLAGICLLPAIALADAGSSQSTQGDFLIKFKPGHAAMLMQSLGAMAENGGELELIADDLVHVKASPDQLTQINSENFITQLNQHPDVEYAQPNYKLRIVEDYKSNDPQIRQMFENIAQGRVAPELLPETLSNTMLNHVHEMISWPFAKKLPDIPSSNVPARYGADPRLPQQWGMTSIKATSAWKKFSGSKKMVVAVIDTGVDYTHEDLVGNLWHNPNEIPNNRIDDDHNGYVDDVIGWDFFKNTNKPYDVTTSTVQLFLGGGNPGHGTHCAGNVGAVGNNAIGISGVSPQVSIMALRFLNEKGQGDTASAVKAINYAVANGAKVLSNSWGSEGEDPSENNKALQDSIKNALAHDVLFVAAAGNGHQGRGYDNDSDPRPGMPASYNIPNIISVAAINQSDELGSFSNWGKKTVHVAAPGVGIYSTMAHNKYGSKIAFIASWDGTSMATPHVAGAAALIWAAHPNYSVLDVKNVLLKTVTKIPALDSKLVSGGKINVEAALQ